MKKFVFLEHPVDNPILVDGGEHVGADVQLLAVEQNLLGYGNNDNGIDSNNSGGGDGEGNGLEDEDVVNPDERKFVEDSSDSWDGSNEDVIESVQMGVGVMNSDYDSEELHSLKESSSDDDIGDDTNDSSEDELKTPMGKGKGQKRTFPVFKPIAKVEHIRFEKDMLFTSLKQFKEAITDYVVYGGWGIGFVKNDLQRNMWRPSGVQPIQPLIKRKPPGRPKKKKARKASEPVGAINRTSAANKSTMHTITLGAPTQPWTSSPSPLPSFQSSMHTFSPCTFPQLWTSSSRPCVTYQTSMRFSSSPSAPYQTSMHFSSSLSALYQYSMHNSATPFPPPQSSMHSSSPGAHQTPTGSSNLVQSNSNPIAPPNCPIPRLRRKRRVTSETLNASKNVSRYIGAIKFAGSQSSTNASRKNE
nr:hypothetical protein CFP56_36995 [Quercus suber]